MSAKTDENRFRTAKDIERMKSAGNVVSRVLASFTAAKADSAEATTACAENPSEENFSKARDARRTLDDCERDLALVRQHAIKVQSEVDANERAAIAAEIARREAALTVVVDDEALEGAVDLVVRSLEQRRRLEARVAQRRAEVAALNDLRRRVGVPPEEVPTIDHLVVESVVRLGEVALSAQAQLLGRANAEELGGMYGAWPMWRPLAGLREFLTGTEGLIVIRTMPDGTRETSGRDATPVVREAAELLKRVRARRAALEKSKSTSGIAAKAAVTALGLLSAFTMAGG